MPGHSTALNRKEDGPISSVNREVVQRRARMGWIFGSAKYDIVRWSGCCANIQRTSSSGQINTYLEGWVSLTRTVNMRMKRRNPLFVEPMLV